MPTAALETIRAASKALRFVKANVDVDLVFRPVASLAQVSFIVMTDAALGIRSDNSNQDGFMVMACAHDAHIGQEAVISLIGWNSSKLPRVARISLQAEAQAGCVGVDSLDFTRALWALSMDPSLDPPCGRHDADVRQLGSGC